MATSPEYPDLPWVQPRSYSTGRPGHQCSVTGKWYPGGPRFIVVHYTAGAEGYDDAEGGAAYDQRRTDGTSAHYYVDADSVVQCVRTADRSHTARWHGNLWGIHYELCGTAQTRAQWLDTVSRRTLRNAARQMARDMAKYKIPAGRIDTQSEIRSTTARGVCGHVDWTNYWPDDGGGRGTHTDPGAAFPWDVLLADITEFLGGDDMLLTDDLPLTEGQMALIPDDPTIQDGKIKLSTALGGAYIFARVALREVTAVKAGQAALVAALQAHNESGGGASLEQIKAAAQQGAQAALSEVEISWSGPDQTAG
jgi:hypothetical protein